MMKIWLIVLGLAFLGIFQEAAAFAGEEAEGTWHVKGLATNNSGFAEHLKKMGISTVTLKKTEKEDIEVVIRFPMNNTCTEMKLTFEKQEDGTFVHTCGHGKKTVDRMVIHGDSAILFVNMLMHKSKENSNIMAFLGRTPELTPEAKEKFIAEAKEKGLTDDQIIFLPKEVACKKSE